MFPRKGAIFMTAIKGIVTVILAAASGLATAGTIYKYERPDGTTVYSDSPVKGAKLVERLDFQEPPPAGAPAQQARDGSADDFAASRLEAIDEADMRLQGAARALRDAEQRQEKGVEPLPGERLGTVGGKSRLAPSYFDRQQNNAADVDAARAALDEAYRLKNAVRE
jgi:hypothetical protein